MLANFIFHFIFAVFLIWGLLAWIFLYRKINSLRLSLIPMLSQKQIEFPKHRSLFVRSMHCIENEIRQNTTKNINFICNFDLKAIIPMEVIYPFAFLFTKSFENTEKIFYYENTYYTLKDVLVKIEKQTNTKNFNFILTQNDPFYFYWKVETANV